jgi:hypothetical protein
MYGKSENTCPPHERKSGQESKSQKFSGHRWTFTLSNLPCSKHFLERNIPFFALLSNLLVIYYFRHVIERWCVLVELFLLVIRIISSVVLNIGLFDSKKRNNCFVESMRFISTLPSWSGLEFYLFFLKKGEKEVIYQLELYGYLFWSDFIMSR